MARDKDSKSAPRDGLSALEKMREMLLAELKIDAPPSWWWVSMVHEPTNTFIGAYIVKASGPTLAWMIMHFMKWIPPDTSTATKGPLEDERVAKLPPDFLWRKLTREDVEAINKIADSAGG